jgi:hypothetical protein
MNDENKSIRFKRLAKLRGERILKDIHILGNLSNKNNYSYSEEDVRKLFSPIEEELRLAKIRFASRKRNEIKF